MFFGCCLPSDDKFLSFLVVSLVKVAYLTTKTQRQWHSVSFVI